MIMYNHVSRFQFDYFKTLVQFKTGNEIYTVGFELLQRIYLILTGGNRVLTMCHA